MKESEIDQESKELIQRKNISSIIDSRESGKFQLKVGILLGFFLAQEGMQSILMLVLPSILSLEYIFDIASRSQSMYIFWISFVVGDAASGFLSDRFGRKWCLFGANLLLYFSLLAASYATGEKTCFFFLFFYGVGLGISSSIVWYYLIEFYPTKVRSKFFCLSFFWYIFGQQFCAITAQYWMPTLRDDFMYWREWIRWWSKFILPVVVLSCFVIPESPYYLACFKKQEKAIELINQIFEQNEQPKLTNEEEQCIRDIEQISIETSSSQDFAKEEWFQKEKYKIWSSNFLSTFIYTGIYWALPSQYITDTYGYEMFIFLCISAIVEVIAIFFTIILVDNPEIGRRNLLI